MTMPDWDGMMPRERDALVAEKVMEWEPCDGMPSRERRRGHNNYVAVCANCGVRWPTWTSMVNMDEDSHKQKSEALREAGVHPKLIGGRAPDINATHFKGEYGIPNFTTSIEAAWRVVEEMRGEEWDLNLQSKGAGREHPHTAEADFTKNGEIGNFRHAFGENDMEAICLAALRAKGVDV